MMYIVISAHQINDLTNPYPLLIVLVVHQTLEAVIPINQFAFPMGICVPINNVRLKTNHHLFNL